MLTMALVILKEQPGSAFPMGDMFDMEIESLGHILCGCKLAQLASMECTNLTFWQLKM